MKIKGGNIREYLDNPVMFLALGVTPFVIGFSGLLLWGAKNMNKGGGQGGFSSLARVIQQG